MLTDDEILLGGYRYEDLLDLKIVTNRTDLDRKQRELGFPLPVKTGKSQAWFPKSEVNDWLRMRAALRGKPPNATPERPEHAVKPSNVLGRRKVAPKKAFPSRVNTTPSPGNERVQVLGAGLDPPVAKSKQIKRRTVEVTEATE